LLLLLLIIAFLYIGRDFLVPVSLAALIAILLSATQPRLIGNVRRTE